MGIADEDYEWVLGVVEAIHRAGSPDDLRRALMAHGARLGLRGWLEATDTGRWLKCGPEAGETAPWCNASLSPMPVAPRAGEGLIWRESGTYAMALGWVKSRRRWIGWWMSPAPEDGLTLTRWLMRALKPAYVRTTEREWAATQAGLTPREAEVTRWISEGKTDPEIAEILNISKRTVGKHRDNIFAKVGVEKRVMLAHWFHARGVE